MSEHAIVQTLQYLRDQVVPVLGLLETTEGHLGTRDVLLGVLKVLEESVVVPLNTLLLVGIGVSVTLDVTRLSAEKAVESRSNLVAAVLLNGVALSTSGLEKVGTLLSVAWEMLLARGVPCDDRDRELVWQICFRRCRNCEKRVAR